MTLFNKNNFYRNQLREQQEFRYQYHSYLQQCLLEQYEQVRLLAFSPTFINHAVTYQEIVFPPFWCLDTSKTYNTGRLYVQAMNDYAVYLEKYFTGHGFNGFWVFQDATFSLADNVRDFQSCLSVSFILDWGLTEDDRQQILEEFWWPWLETHVDPAYDPCFSLEFHLYAEPTPGQLGPVFVKMIEHLWQLDRLFTLCFSLGTMNEVIGGWGDFIAPQAAPYHLWSANDPDYIDHHLNHLRFFLEQKAEAFLREPLLAPSNLEDF